LLIIYYLYRQFQRKYSQGYGAKLTHLATIHIRIMEKYQLVKLVIAEKKIITR